MRAGHLAELMSLCRRYEDYSEQVRLLGKEIANGNVQRQQFWEGALRLGFSRSEISACRLFVRLAKKEGKQLHLRNWNYAEV